MTIIRSRKQEENTARSRRARNGYALTGKAGTASRCKAIVHVEDTAAEIFREHSDSLATGITPRLLCPSNQKYLSRLLVGTTGIDPSFITWEQLSKQITQHPFLFNPFPEGETSTSLSEEIKTWRQLLTAGKLIPQFLKKLALHEKEHNESELKKKHLYRLKKKSIALLITLILSTIIFYFLYLLIPIMASTIMLSLFIFITVFFTSVLVLDFIYPTILLKIAQNTDQYQQRAETSQELKIAATSSKTENRTIRISFEPDKKKTPHKHTLKGSAFHNRLTVPTYFFQLTPQQTPQRALEYHETNSREIATSSLNQSLCAILA